MRVVAGSGKGRGLVGAKSPVTRPIMDRVKTALFDIRTPDIAETRFLDLFAGTGGIGIEALSRGSAFAPFIEPAPAALPCVRQNLALPRFTAPAEVLRTDALSYLPHADSHGPQYATVSVAPA